MYIGVLYVTCRNSSFMEHDIFFWKYVLYSTISKANFSTLCMNRMLVARERDTKKKEREREGEGERFKYLNIGERERERKKKRARETQKEKDPNTRKRVNLFLETCAV
mmetsp:Transcript_93558/g.151050  ORF Transcript_93558/g.151050 Transcript_93558/m.151050 type:complete len:108 (-) Transcript_93558:361-684(-)